MDGLVEVSSAASSCRVPAVSGREILLPEVRLSWMLDSTFNNSNSSWSASGAPWHSLSNRSRSMSPWCSSDEEVSEPRPWLWGDNALELLALWYESATEFTRGGCNGSQSSLLATVHNAFARAALFSSSMPHQGQALRRKVSTALNSPEQGHKRANVKSRTLKISVWPGLDLTVAACAAKLIP